MAKPKTVPRFASYDEAANWLDKHSTAFVATSPADFELAAEFKVRVVDNFSERVIDVDHTLGKQISQIAQRQGLSVEVLVNRWLREKIIESQTLASA